MKSLFRFGVLLALFGVLHGAIVSTPFTEYGYWGGWTDYYEVDGSLICGAEMRFEDYQGGGDDTAANGLRFRYCQINDWYSQTQLEFEGFWGDWKGMVMCPENQYVGGFMVRMEENQGSDGDDTTLNGLKLLCRKFGSAARVGKVITVYEGIWGIWNRWHLAGSR